MLNPRRVTAKYPGALVLVVARLVANGRVYGMFVRVVADPTGGLHTVPIISTCRTS